MERKFAQDAGVEVSDDRVVSGYASVFNQIDLIGDTVKPGAYRDAVEQIRSRKGVQMLLNHSPVVIGRWTEVAEDQKGLRVSGKLTPGHSRADDAYASIKAGHMAGLTLTESTEHLEAPRGAFFFARRERDTPMASMTNYLEKALLDHVLGKAAYPMPTTVHLALYTSDPTDTGAAGAEVSQGGYQRQAITAVMPVVSSTAGRSTNTAAITFGPATADWGTVTHLGILDAATGGNPLLYAPLAVAKTIANGDSFQIAANQLSVTLA